MRDLKPISSPPSLSFAAVAGQLATPSSRGQTFVSPGWLRFGGAMVLKMAFVLLVAWLVGVIGFYNIGDLTHVLLLVGLMLLLLGFLRARDAASAGAAGVEKRSGKP